MSEKPLLLKIDKPYLAIELYSDLLKIDLKGSAKNEIEEALENKQVLRETIGVVLGLFVPLHINVKDIESVNTDSKGTVTVKLRLHRDLKLPLGSPDAKTFTDKLQPLLKKQKEKKIESIVKAEKIKEVEKEERLAEEEMITSGSSGGSGFMTQPPGILDQEEKASREMLEEEKNEEED